MMDLRIGGTAQVAVLPEWHKGKAEVDLRFG